MSDDYQKTILVTGGAGFIGSNFVRYMYDKYPECRIVVLDALTYAGNVKNLPVDINETVDESDSRIRFWYGNVVNAEIVDTLIGQVDVVVHFAAETHVTRSIYDNTLFFRTDVLGTQAIVNAILKHRDQIERFVHISTSEVYGTAQTKRMDEEHPLLPMSPYAAAKTGADVLVASYIRTYDVPAVIVRPFNNYGPYQHLEKAIPRFITSCILDEEIRLHGDGLAARDYIYVDDTCRGIDMILQADENLVCGEVFNLASDQDRSMKSIALDIVHKMGQGEQRITYVGERPGQVIRHTGCSKKVRETLGWSPEVSWDEGMQRTIDWYSSKRDWWEAQRWMRRIPIVTKAGKREMH